MLRYTMGMKTLTYTFLALALTGMLTGHVGGAMVALLWAVACWYYGLAMEEDVTVVDEEYQMVQAVSTVMSAQTEGNL